MTPVNDAPVAVNDPGLGDPPFAVNEDTVLNFAGRGVLDNDMDVDGDDLDVVIEGVTPVGGKYHITSNRGAPVVIDAEDGHVHLRSDRSGGVPAPARRARR